MPNHWPPSPLLVELKKAVLERRDGRDIRLLRFAELAQRLEQMLPKETFGETEVRTTVILLANHGLARLLKFGDLVLLLRGRGESHCPISRLTPAWATKSADRGRT